MSRKITFGLSVSSVRQAQRELMAYKRDVIDKCSTFIHRLAEKGIIVAKQNIREYGNYITFEIQTSPTATGAKGLLIATNTGHITSRWLSAGVAVRTADVSPLMMVEFGAGPLASGDSANPKAGDFGMGQGTFPDQTHAFDPDGWWYLDADDGEWHHSRGVTPSMPMYHAWESMFTEIANTAKEVFGGA